MAKLEKLISRKLTILSRFLFLSATGDSDLLKKHTGFSDAMQNCFFTDNEYFYDHDWFEATWKKYFDADPNIFWEFTNKGFGAGEELWRFVRSGEVPQNETGFWQVVDKQLALSTFIQITHPLSYVIQQKLTRILESKGVPEDEIMDAIMELSAPIKQNGPAKEVAELKEISKLKHSASDAEWQGELRTHAEKWAYLGYRDPFSKGYDYDFFLERLDEPEGEQLQINKYSDINFTKEQQEYINLMKEFVFFRNYRTEIFYSSFYFIEDLIKKLSLKYNLGEKDLSYYTLPEIKDLFQHEKKVEADSLLERKQGSAIKMTDRKMRLLTGEELMEEASKFEESHSEVNEIRGMVACRGIVNGTAKIVDGSQNQGKVLNGDILVTSMTTPDFIPSMRRAAAFVTDEGGITCHAAIVAREMNKPCIIGTKNATKILKDGDMVEVDANKGIVKISEANA